jgi:hypothetical protein
VGLARPRRGKKVNCGARIRRKNASSLPEPPEAPPRLGPPRSLSLLARLPHPPTSPRSSATARARVLASSVGLRHGTPSHRPASRRNRYGTTRSLPPPPTRKGTPDFPGLRFGDIARDSRLPEPFPRRSIAGSVPLCAPRPPRAVEGASAQIRCCCAQPFSSSSGRLVLPHRSGYWTSEIRPERGWFLEALGWADRLSPQFSMFSPIPPLLVVDFCHLCLPRS